MLDELAKIVLGPAIAPGVVGVLFTVIASKDGSLVSHALDAITFRLPPVEPAMVLIEFVVDVPVHPPGNIQM